MEQSQQSFSPRTAHPPNTSGGNDRGDRLGSQTFGALKTPLIGWTVDEIILTESIVGKTTHVEHGRWRLCGGAV